MFNFFRPQPAAEPAAGNSSESAELLKEVKSKADRLESELQWARMENDRLRTEVDKLKKDQEDLLVLMADQDDKLHKYKERLKSLGQAVSHFSCSLDEKKRFSFFSGDIR